MLFFKIALLNIKKHYKRSLVIIFAVTISVVVMILVGGMMDGMRDNFFNNLLTESGHLQLHAKGYKKRLNPLSLNYVIQNPDKIIYTLKKNRNVKTIENVKGNPLITNS